MSEAIEAVAADLGNTAAICRKCYVHPSVLEAYQDPKLHRQWVRRSNRAPRLKGLAREESALLAFLESRSAASRKS